MRCWRMRCWPIWRCWGPKHIPVEWIEISEGSITFNQEWETFQLSARVLPHNASSKKVIRSSSAPDYVSVSDNWLVTALSPTNDWVIITATSEEWGYIATCDVTYWK